MGVTNRDGDEEMTGDNRRLDRFVPCAAGRHGACPEVGPPNSADSPIMGEAAVCECPCHDDGAQVRATNPYAYRSGEWADLINITDHANGRRCYLVRFPDGASDFWPVDDEDAGYEFREQAPSEVTHDRTS